MAFPINGVLDAFNTTSFDHLDGRAGWSTTPYNGNSWLTDGTPTQAVASASTGGNMWGTNWTNAECWAKLGSSFGSGPINYLCARILTWNVFSLDCYAIKYAPGSFLLGRIAGGTWFLLDTVSSPTISVGDSVGIEVIGSAIKGYYKSGAGSWGQVASATDSNHTGSGGIGMVNDGSNSIGFNDFGGGSAPAPPVDISCAATQAQAAAELRNVGHFSAMTQAQLAGTALVKNNRPSMPSRRFSIRGS